MKIWDLHTDDIRTMVWQMDESTEDILMQMPQAESLRSAMQNFKSAQRQKEFLFARYLVFLFFGQQETIAYNQDGKPFLTDNSAQISISHSGNYICVAAHPTLPVGVDIEVLGTKIAKVKRRFLSESELTDLKDDADNRKGHLYWSAKEAIYKIAGKKAVDFQKSIAIQPFELTARQFQACTLPDGEKYKITFKLHSNFVLTIADRIKA